MSNNMNGYYSINLGEDVVSAANDPFWQQYGLPSIELGGIEEEKKQNKTALKLWLGIGAAVLLGLGITSQVDKYYKKK